MEEHFSLFSKHGIRDAQAQDFSLLLEQIFEQRKIAKHEYI